MALQHLSDGFSARRTRLTVEGKAFVGLVAVRIRVGEYRVLYRITDKELLILVVKVGHRRDVYR
jgi:hypothetical protein